MRILFVCSRNQWRSPTAETVFRHYPGWQVKSAGTAAGARRQVNRELLNWADVIFVMEKKHQQRLRQAFGDVLQNRKITVLFIPDNYRYMDPELVELLKDAVNALLPPTPKPPINNDPAARRHADENYND